MKRSYYSNSISQFIAEDNDAIYGRISLSAQLVARAVQILEAMNVKVNGPSEVREHLQLRSP